MNLGSVFFITKKSALKNQQGKEVSITENHVVMVSYVLNIIGVN